jgi:hypothetical protein
MKAALSPTIPLKGNLEKYQQQASRKLVKGSRRTGEDIRLDSKNLIQLKVVKNCLGAVGQSLDARQKDGTNKN